MPEYKFERCDPASLRYSGGEAVRVGDTYACDQYGCEHIINYPSNLDFYDAAGFFLKQTLVRRRLVAALGREALRKR